MEKSSDEKIADLISELEQVKERLDKCEQGQKDILFFLHDAENGLPKMIEKMIDNATRLD